MTQKEYDRRIDKIIDGLGCSIKEAEEILQADLDIDRNKPVDFGLSAEEEKKALKQAHKGKERKTQTAYKWDKRERKVNVTKKEIIDYLMECFKDYENVAITNAERQIRFSANGNDYELTLVQKRKPKD